MDEQRPDGLVAAKELGLSQAWEVGAFNSMWCKRVARAASSLGAARRVVVEFRARDREPGEPVDDDGGLVNAA